MQPVTLQHGAGILPRLLQVHVEANSFRCSLSRIKQTKCYAGYRGLNTLKPVFRAGARALATEKKKTCTELGSSSKPAGFALVGEING